MAIKTSNELPDDNDVLLSTSLLSLGASPVKGFFSSLWNLSDSITYSADTNFAALWDNYAGAGAIVGVIEDDVELSHSDQKDNDDFGITPEAISSGYENNPNTINLIAAEATGNETDGIAYDAFPASFQVNYGASAYLDIANSINQLTNSHSSKDKWGFDGLSPASLSGPALIPSDNLFGSQWHLNDTSGFDADINVTSVWDDYTGAGVIVGIIDDGVEFSHYDLNDNYDTSIDYDATSADGSAYPDSGENHGTAVAGVIASEANGVGTVGVAFGATIAGFQLNYGSSSDADIADNLNQIANVDIFNNSWGYGGYFYDNFATSNFTASYNAVENAVANGRDGLGTNIVFAAGNSRSAGDNVNYHNYQNSVHTIAVAAVDSNGVNASFSTPGAALLVAAAGVGVVTTDREGSDGYVSTDYVGINGTSFSTPIVSAVIALILEANADLGYRDVQEILAYSARLTDSGDNGWNYNGADNWNGGGMHFSHDYGFGLVDAYNAVRLAETWDKQSTYHNVIEVGGSTSPGSSIPDNNRNGLSDTINIAEDIDIDQVEITVDISHTWIGDLVVTLTAPDGTESVLVNRPGVATFSRSGTSQDDIKFTLTSTQHWGESSQGEWTLTVIDKARNDVGSLNSWSLNIIGDDIQADDTYIYTSEFASLSDTSRALLTDSNGGIDTINVAAVASNTTLDFAAGSGSIAGRALSLAAGTVIENVYFGDGDDQFTGNSADNTILGGRGDDTLSGGDGIDSLIYWGTYDDFTFDFLDLDVLTIAYGGADIDEGTDLVDGFENFYFGADQYTLAQLYDLYGDPGIDPPVVDDAPHTVTLTNNSIDEDATSGAYVGTVSAVDPEGAELSYSFSVNPDNMFNINSVTGDITLAGTLDFEANNNYSVTVDVSDDTNITQKIFNIAIGDVNEAPHTVTLDNNSIDEGALIGTVIGTVSATDPEGVELTYSLTDDLSGLFTIDSGTGEIKIISDLGYETAGNYDVTVEVSDGVFDISENFTINVNDVAPPATLLTPFTVTTGSGHDGSYNQANTDPITTNLINYSQTEIIPGALFSTDENGNLAASTTGEWGDIENILIENAEGATINVDGFVHTNILLGDPVETATADAHISINAAKRGDIITGTGNDIINITAFSRDGGPDNMFNITSGAGNDTIDLTGYSRHTLATIDAGDGNDRVSVTGKVTSSIDGGAGDDTLSGGNNTDVMTGGTGSDDFIIGYKNGKDIINDFDILEDDLVFTSTTANKISISSNSDNDAVVSVSRNHNVTLIGIREDEITADLFEYI